MLFLPHGIACLSLDGMKRDFERFGLSHLRMLTGTPGVNLFITWDALRLAGRHG